MGAAKTRAAYLDALRAGAAARTSLQPLLALAASAQASVGVSADADPASWSLVPLPASESDRLFALARTHRRLDALGLAAAVLSVAAARAPADGAARTNHALALFELGQLDEAAAEAEQAVVLAPGLAAAWLNLALVRRARGDGRGAALAREHAARLEPDAAALHLQAGSELQAQGRLLEAQGACRYAMQVAAATPEAWINLGTALLDAGDAAAAEDAARAALALAPRERRAAANLLLAQQYNPRHGADDLRQAAASLGQLWQVPVQRPVWQPPGPVLRVGYLGSDFRQHPIGWLMAPVLAAHDPARVSVHVLDTQPGGHPHDALHQALRAQVPNWHAVAGLDDDALHARVRGLGLDVLVELAGHTDGGRLGVLARRAAPVQLSWLGYFASTGVEEVDGVVTGDTVGDPPAQAWFTEPLLHLGRPHLAWQPPPYAPAVPPQLASETCGRLTFGSFNNGAKLSDPTVALWSRVLLACPDSRLVLRWRCFGDPALAQVVRTRFAAHGVAAERIDCAPALPHADMLAAYAEVDVALDPVPFSGLITSLEALWMGLPVITLDGLRPVSRQTTMLLRALGCGDWIATRPAAYAEAACRIAQDSERRLRWRSEARERLAHSALMDGADLARRLEDLYLRCRAAAAEVRQ